MIIEVVIAIINEATAMVSLAVVVVVAKVGCCHRCSKSLLLSLMQHK